MRLFDGAPNRELAAHAACLVTKHLHMLSAASCVCVLISSHCNRVTPCSSVLPGLLGSIEYSTQSYWLLHGT
jgi:hypothetical protein